jgi:hypothetical protein
LTQSHAALAEAAPAIFQPLFSDKELAEILVMTVAWVRSHATEIPGFERLGSYYRFRSAAIEHWLGSLDRLLEAEQVSALLKVPTSWVYANADQIPGPCASDVTYGSVPALSANSLADRRLCSDHLRCYNETAIEAPRKEDRGAGTLPAS